MRIGLVVMAALAVASPSLARFAQPPEPVGPPPSLLYSGCPLSFGREGWPTAGAPIPYSALKLGELLPRTPIPFYTGGSGTSNVMLAMKREQAGALPFDPARGSKPLVYAADPGDRNFQRLPIRGAAEGMIFAPPASPAEARIAALALALPARPAGSPTLRAFDGFTSGEGCATEPVDIYATRMTAAELRRLFARGGCGWKGAAGCARPRGRVLFVRAADYGERGFEHRWIDYDLLGAR